MDDTKEVIAGVRAKIAASGLSEAQCARLIGVTHASLKRHIGGAYVRSDTLAKYRRWVSGVIAMATKTESESFKSKEVLNAISTHSSPFDVLAAKPDEPLRVVDLFGGCGGLSLGFELSGNGNLYRTVLSVDIEEAMVRVFNANHKHKNKNYPIGCKADLAEFINESEVLAFYLNHLALSEGDELLRQELDSLHPFPLSSFQRKIQQIDDDFIRELTKIRSDKTYQSAFTKIDKNSLSQTSVRAFHDALKLPQPGISRPTFSPPLWGAQSNFSTSCVHEMPSIPGNLREECKLQSEALWEVEVEKLRKRAMGSGSGQLASAAQKIQRSLNLIDGEAYGVVRKAWIEWRAERDAARRVLFEDEKILQQFRRIYKDGRDIHVLLGGPPCQGFSRIGRGKIRSLREQSVHVQADAKLGDSRNELMLQYVLFIAALAPAAFLFENVRHFQAEVKTPDGRFKATDILSDAISQISHDELEYEVASQIILASNHLVPQTRERFFMVGLRNDLNLSSLPEGSASWCLSLPKYEPVPLKAALSGLPEPVYASKTSTRAGSTSTLLKVKDFHLNDKSAVSSFTEWIRQPPPKRLQHFTQNHVDAHCTRDSRCDDRAFFELLGPGKRWMDYRSDDNALIRDMARIVQWVRDNNTGDVAGVDQARINYIIQALDGSLPLRLLLNRIPLDTGGHEHHLCAPNYLKKRDGDHGDWLARLDAETPSKTILSHMGKDTYAYIHPSSPRTISVREAARVQTFPDWFKFGSIGLVDGYRVIGNAVPPLLSAQLALRLIEVLKKCGVFEEDTATS